MPPDSLDPLAAPIPSFSPPRRPPMDPPLTGQEAEEPTPNPTPQGEPSPRRSVFGPIQKWGTPATGTPTGTSTTSGDRPAPSKQDVRLTGELVAAAIGFAFLGAAALVRMRKGRKLRRPTPKQLDGMGAPLGRIAARHVPVEWLNADLVDALELGSAVAAWAGEGPITVPDRPGPNLPADLNPQE